MLIRTARVADLNSIATLEKMIEDARIAASFEVLRGRLLVFPDGFFVAVVDERVVGYLESIRWDGPSFDRFEDIRGYESMHVPTGNILYIAFLAVDSKYRRRGIATQLVQAAEMTAAAIKTNRIQLVSLPKLVDFYASMGFRRIRTLPQFLETSAGVLMQKDLSPG